jgi:FkbM family methyltransferase
LSIKEDSAGRSRDELKLRVRRLRDKLARTVRHVQGLRDKLTRARRQVQSLRDELARADHQVRGLRGKLAGANRQVPAPGILPGLLARRHTVFPPPSSVAAAVARERDFAGVSSSYCDDTPLSESDVLVNIDHVPLWVPATHVRKVKLPWALIQKVRAVAVGGVMLDIGANIGQTCVPRILLGDFHAIYAAEPEPANYARLKATVAANRMQGFVLPDRVAIGSRDGVLQLHIGHYRSHAAATDRDPDAIEVPSLTLDSWIERLGVDPDEVSFVKTDTNGYELDVLHGAARLLSKRLAVWQIEVAPTFMARLGTTVEMLSDELSKHFTHFIDISHKAPGEVVRPLHVLTDALTYLETMANSRSGKPPQTDLLCLNC